MRTVQFSDCVIDIASDIDSPASPANSSRCLCVASSSSIGLVDDRYDVRASTANNAAPITINVPTNSSRTASLHNRRDTPRHTDETHAEETHRDTHR